MSSSSKSASRVLGQDARVKPGFIRGIFRHAPSEPLLSRVAMEPGDPQDESSLVRILAAPEIYGIDDALLARAHLCMEALCRHGVTRFNDQEPEQPGPPQGRHARVLLVDQPEHAALPQQHGPVHPAGLAGMLEAARGEHPRAELILLVHPETPRRERERKTALAARVHATVVLPGRHPFELVRQAAAVYTLTSHLGFEALLLGRPVSCFETPFYAGWGLTDDRVAKPRGGPTRSLAQLFAAAYLRHNEYFDPHTGQRCELETIIDHVARQRAYFEQNRGVTYGFGFGLWKHNYVRAYLRCPGNRVTFSWGALDARLRGFGDHARILVWGVRHAPGLEGLAAQSGVPTWRMEDGFLRSVGLGSDFHPPASLVIDREGIYFDPTRPSELESILQNTDFTPDELQRAQALRELIVRAEISKYNVGNDRTPLERPSGGQRVILVPGQVEDDASIQLGCVDVRTNAGLLQAVRAENPDAYVIFKPHPDVTAANREGAVAVEQALQWCDRVISNVPLPKCLGLADEVHTMTSLTGFEALLRGLRVATYGRPFYSGWGLTTDRHRTERRQRTLSLDELVAGTLLRYPRYISRHTGLFATPEVVVRELHAEIEAQRGAAPTTARSRKLRKAVHALRGLFHAP